MLRNLLNRKLTVGTALLILVVGAIATNLLTFTMRKEKKQWPHHFAYIDTPPEIEEVTSSLDSVDMMMAWRTHDTLHLEFIDDCRVSRFMPDSSVVQTSYHGE